MLHAPHSQLLALLAALLGLAACTACTSHSNDEERAARPSGPTEELLTVELTTIGWDARADAPVVLLRDLESGQVVPIWIGVAEARAIGMALHGIEAPRPMTHDLMADLLTNLDAELEAVVIHDLRGGTYYGLLKLRLDDEDAPRWIDTRPSDGLALALRRNAPIHLARKLLADLPEYDFLAPQTDDQVVRAGGLTVVAPTAALRETHGLPQREGLLVIEVEGGAAAVGLRRGDLIVAVDGAPVSVPLELLTAIRRLPQGATLPLTYWRDGEEHTVALPLITDSKEGRRIA